MLKAIPTIFSLFLIISCNRMDKQSTFLFEHGGIKREYILYVPDNIQPKAPLIFVLHGLGSTSSHIREYSQMDIVAKKYGFVVCYPQGTESSQNSIHTKKGSSFWNVGYDIHMNEYVNDVSFLKSLARYLQEKYNLDPRKTFCSGMSNGGDMSYLLGCEAADVFKAIASVTGCMMAWIYESCANNPIPVFQIHGTKDDITHYNGDMKNKDKWGAYLGVETTIDFWIDQNKSLGSMIDTIGFTHKSDSSYIISKKYINGINKNEIWFYKVVNGGHDWVQKPVIEDFNTSEEIWRFFENFISLNNLDI